MKKFFALLMFVVMTVSFSFVYADEKPQTLTFLHTWGAETHPNKPMVDSVVGYLEKTYGIEIEEESLDASGLRTKVATLYAANEGPDLVRFWSGAVMKPYAEGGKLLDLTPYLPDGFENHLVPGALNNYTFDGKVYGLPMGMSSYQLYVNKAMFEQYGLPLPTDWDSLIKAVETFHNAGITPFAMGGKYSFGTLIGYFVWQLMRNSVGPELLEKALSGEIEYKSDPGFKAAVEKFIELVKLGAFSDGAVMMDRDEAEVGVFNGTIPMYYCGNWVVQQFYMDGCTVNPDDIVIMNLPAWEGAAGDHYVTTNIGDCFMASANTKNPELTAKVLIALAQRFGLEVYERGSSTSAYLLENPDESNLTPLFIALKNFLSGVGGGNPYGQYLNTDQLEAMYYPLQALMLGEYTADDFITEIDGIY